MHTLTVGQQVEQGRVLIASRLGEDAPARLESELLVAHALSVSRSWLFAHDRDWLTAAQATGARSLLERRCTGEPVAHLLGEREFWSLAFEVDASTLIPRPETELLVELALACLPDGQPVAVADLGTGSGVIAIAIACERPLADVLATDIWPATLAVAARNAVRHAPGRVAFCPGDWWQPLAGRRFDLVVSNPPYIAEADPHLARGDLRFEAPRALVAGPDGLDALAIIIAGAARYLLPGGWLLLEHGHDQAEAVAILMEQAGLKEVQGWRDAAGLPRVAGARAAPACQPPGAPRD